LFVYTQIVAVAPIYRAPPPFSGLDITFSATLQSNVRSSFGLYDDSRFPREYVMPKNLCVCFFTIVQQVKDSALSIEGSSNRIDVSEHRVVIVTRQKNARSLQQSI
jgi:hypothetical protein